MYCPKCGSQSQVSRFCRSCGANLEVVSQVLGEPSHGTVKLGNRQENATLALFNKQVVTGRDAELNGHQAVAVFGQIFLELADVRLPPGETQISVVSVFGEAVIVVPDEIELRITGFSAFSGVRVGDQHFGNGLVSVLDFKTAGYDRAVHRLHLDLSAIFGAINVSAPSGDLIAAPGSLCR